MTADPGLEALQRSLNILGLALARAELSEAKPDAALDGALQVLTLAVAVPATEIQVWRMHLSAWEAAVTAGAASADGLRECAGIISQSLDQTQSLAAFDEWAAQEEETLLAALNEAPPVSPPLTAPEIPAEPMPVSPPEPETAHHVRTGRRGLSLVKNTAETPESLADELSAPEPVSADAGATPVPVAPVPQPSPEPARCGRFFAGLPWHQALAPVVPAAHDMPEHLRFEGSGSAEALPAPADVIIVDNPVLAATAQALAYAAAAESGVSPASGSVFERATGAFFSGIPWIQGGGSFPSADEEADYAES